MSREIVKRGDEPEPIPDAAHKFAQRALREHQRAEGDLRRAVAHIVKSGEALIRARELCDYGQWHLLFELHFKEEESFSMRTALKYMQLARDWPQLVARFPAAALLSQRQAFKALRALSAADQSVGPRRASPKRAARGAIDVTANQAASDATHLSQAAENADAATAGPKELDCAARGAVQRASLQAASDATRRSQAAGVKATDREAERIESGAAAPTPALPRWEREKETALTSAFRWGREKLAFLRAALQVIDSVDAPVIELVAYGAPLTVESEMVRTAFNRLRTMLETELEGAEAQRAASQESDRGAGRTESGATAPTPTLPRREREKGGAA